jgi:hypothetical protein
MGTEKHRIVDESEGDELHFVLKRGEVFVAAAVVHGAAGLAALRGMTLDAIKADLRRWLEGSRKGSRAEMPYEIGRVERKLREAQFFLREVRAAADRDGGDPEVFDFYLSAFLSAAKSVEMLLKDGWEKTYGPWREAWDSRLSPADKRLMDFVATDRNHEVHRAGSRREARDTEIKLAAGTSYLDGSTMVTGPPGMPDAATIIKPDYYFTIGGAEARVPEVCAAHLALLHRLVRDFKADHP